MVQLAFPLFSGALRFDSKAMARSLSRRHRRNKFAAEKNDGDISAINVDGVTVLIKPISAPVPGDDIEHTQQFARRGWHEVSDRPEDHRAHAIVTTFGTRNPKEAAVALTLVIEEMCQSPDCIGVLWGASGVLAHRGIVTRLAANVSVDEPALSLWVSGLPYRSEAGIGLSTRGLTIFAERELHFLPSEQHDPETLFGRAMDVAEYLYANGPVILDGQSVGYSKTDVIRAKWTDEAGEKEGEVTRWIELSVEQLDPST